MLKFPVGTAAFMGGLHSNLTDFTESWGNLVLISTEYLLDQGECMHLDRARTSTHGQARNELVQGFLGDWLFMTDTDHSFEPDLLVRLHGVMQTNDLDVVTGLYMSKVWPHTPVIYNWAQNDALDTILDWPKDKKFFEIGAAGGGCLIVRRRVFDRIRNELGELPFTLDPRWTTEDFAFFERCRRLGIKCYCAPHIESNHLMTRPIYASDFARHALPMPVPEKPKPMMDIVTTSPTPEVVERLIEEARREGVEIPVVRQVPEEPPKARGTAATPAEMNRLLTGFPAEFNVHGGRGAK